MRLVYRVRAGKHDPESNAVSRSVGAREGCVALCTRNTKTTKAQGVLLYYKIMRMAYGCWRTNALETRSDGDNVARCAQSVGA